MKDIWSDQNCFKILSDFTNQNSKLYHKYYLLWKQLTNSLPSEWVIQLQKTSHVISQSITTTDFVCSPTNIFNIGRLSTKLIYSLINNPETESKGEIIFKNNQRKSATWKDACNSIYLMTIDSLNRYFQFKILHNYLAVNSKLKIWKLTDSSCCSFCFLYEETVYHIFCECIVTKTLYYQINEWSSCYNIELPDKNKSCIRYGILPCNESNILQNVLILLFKKLVYNSRNNIKMLRLETFISSVKNLEKLEYRIALQKGKLSKHQTKWKLLSNIE